MPTTPAAAFRPRLLAALAVAGTLTAGSALGGPRPADTVAASATAAFPAPAATTPASGAYTVAVLGDAFGDALLGGLRQDLGRDTGFVVVAPRTPHGLAEKPGFDWAAAAAALAASHVDVVVMMLGGDDLVPLPDGRETPAEPGTARWRTLYGARVTATVAAYRAAGLAVIWVGLPAVADADLAAGYVEINELVRDKATAAGARFVDSWDAFMDENGRYSAEGPDLDGRLTTLRSADGEGFTKAGAVKLASFVDADLRRGRRDKLTSLAARTDVVLPSEPDLDNDINAQIRRELGLPPLQGSPLVGARGSADRRGPTLILTAPPSSRDGTLATSVPGPAALSGLGGASLSERVMAQGQPLPPRPGRIDDFSWPRPGAL